MNHAGTHEHALPLHPLSVSEPTVTRVAGLPNEGEAYALVHGAEALAAGADAAVVALAPTGTEVLGAFDIELLDLAVLPGTSPCLVALGFGGELLQLCEGEWQPATHGPTSGIQRLAVLEGELYGLGMRGQLARLVDDEWQTIPLDTTAWLRGVVGRAGERYVYGDASLIGLDGHEVRFPRHVEIADLSLLPNGELLICAWDGTLLQGQGSAWRVLPALPRPQPTTYSLAQYRGDTYMATSAGVMRLRQDGTAVRLSGRATFELTVAGGRLWSRGAAGLERFDGASWTRVSLPQNSGVRTIER